MRSDQNQIILRFVIRILMRWFDENNLSIWDCDLSIDAKFHIDISKYFFCKSPAVLPSFEKLQKNCGELKVLVTWEFTVVFFYCMFVFFKSVNQFSLFSLHFENYLRGSRSIWSTSGCRKENYNWDITFSNFFISKNVIMKQIVSESEIPEFDKIESVQTYRIK